VGSRFLFPQRFDRAVARLLRDPHAVDVVPEYAIWYFGPALRLEVDPARLKMRINDYVRDHSGDRWIGTSFLDAADWSNVLEPIEDSPVHRGVFSLVEAGADYHESRAFRDLTLLIKMGQPGVRNGLPLRTEADVEAYIRYCHDLIASVRKQGVVRHRPANAFYRLRIRHRDTRSVLIDASERDIGVAIGPSGEMVRHLGGKHRTAIAMALKLPRLPVEVRMVHVRWLAAEMERTGLPAHRALPAGIRMLQAREDTAAA
jgi:hypothetical protein